MLSGSALALTLERCLLLPGPASSLAPSPRPRSHSVGDIHCCLGRSLLTPLSQRQFSVPLSTGFFMLQGGKGLNHSMPLCKSMYSCFLIWTSYLFFTNSYLINLLTATPKASSLFSVVPELLFFLHALRKSSWWLLATHQLHST